MEGKFTLFTRKVKTEISKAINKSEILIKRF
jgi:hypothetical protein